MIAAYANQRDRDNRTPDIAASGDDDRTQWAEGNAANQTDLADAVGGFEDRVYFGEQSPDYSVVGRGEGEDGRRARPAPVHDRRRAGRRRGRGARGRRGQRGHHDVRRRRRRPGRQHVPPAALRDPVRLHELPAVRPGQREQRGALPPRPGRAGAEGRAVADPRRRRLPGDHPGRGRRGGPDRLGGRRLHRHRPVPRRRARVVRDDDRRRVPGGHRPPDAAHRRDQLRPQRGEGHGRRVRRHGDALRVGRDRPDPQGLARRVPRHGQGPLGDPRGR